MAKTGKMNNLKLILDAISIAVLSIAPVMYNLFSEKANKPRRKKSGAKMALTINGKKRGRPALSGGKKVKTAIPSNIVPIDTSTAVAG